MPKPAPTAIAHFPKSRVVKIHIWNELASNETSLDKTDKTKEGWGDREGLNAGISSANP
jgi:hypothetical protein